MTDIIIITAVIVIAALASLYIYKAKKRGQKCIGCPHASACKNNCSCKNNG